MKDYVLSFKLFETSIGIEKIYKHYYSDIPEKIFNQLLDLDPTTPFKTTQSGSVITQLPVTDKAGKYMRWLVREYRNGHFDTFVKEGDLQKLKFLREELKLLGTAWLRKKLGKNIDILQYSYPKLTNLLGKYLDLYRDETAEKEIDVQYDLLYEDDTWRIFVPLNADTSMYLCGKDTQWCTNYQGGWDMWATQGYVFYRFIPKKSNYKKLRMSWHMRHLEESNWAFAYTYSGYHLYPKYASRLNDPFDVKELPDEVGSRSNKDHNELVYNIKSIPEEAQEEIRNYHQAVAETEPVLVENVSDFWSKMKSVWKNVKKYGPGKETTQLKQHAIDVIKRAAIGNQDVKLTKHGLNIPTPSGGTIILDRLKGTLTMPAGSEIFVGNKDLEKIYQQILANSFKDD